MEAAGVLKDVPYKIEWKEFRGGGAAAWKRWARARSIPGWSATRRLPSPRRPTLRSRRSATIRQSNEGLAVLVAARIPESTASRICEAGRSPPGRGSIGRQLIAGRARGREAGPRATCRSCSWRRRTPRWRTPRARSMRGRHGSRTPARKRCCSSRSAVITAEGLTPGLGFQVASPDAIRDKRPELARRGMRSVTSGLQLADFLRLAHGGPCLVGERCAFDDLGRVRWASRRGVAQLAEPGQDTRSRRSTTSVVAGRAEDDGSLFRRRRPDQAEAQRRRHRRPFVCGCDRQGRGPVGRAP